MCVRPSPGPGVFDNAGRLDIICIRMIFRAILPDYSWRWRAARHCVIRYAKPRTLDEALALLGEARWRILAGGTDFYPALGSKPLSENVLDVNGLAELRGTSETASHLVIGARTTWTDIIRQPLPPAFDALKQAAREVGSAQI